MPTRVWHQPQPDGPGSPFGYTTVELTTTDREVAEITAYWAPEIFAATHPQD